MKFAMNVFPFVDAILAKYKTYILGQNFISTNIASTKLVLETSKEHSADNILMQFVFLIVLSCPILILIFLLLENDERAYKYILI